jgi:hypothetical protein
MHVLVAVGAARVANRQGGVVGTLFSWSRLIQLLR